jgi:uncharacterized RDD family membrane protein YckC
MKACGYCGGQNPDDAIHCSGCGTEFENSAPPALLPIQGDFNGAGYGIRFLARLIDTVFGLGIGFVAGLVTGIILAILAKTGGIEPGWQKNLHGFSLATLAFAFLGNILYHFFCEGIHGATLGKLCCGIRVVRLDGSPSNFRGAIIRTLAFYIDSLFFGLVALNSMNKSSLKQRYGDVWGKTLVLKDNDIAPESQRSPMHFILGFFLGIGCWVMAMIAGLVLRII